MNKELKFWIVFIGLLLLAWWVYTRVMHTAADAKTAFQNLISHPIQTLFG